MSMSTIKPRFSQRLIFTGTLRTLCPLHIGGLDWALHTDMALTRDVLGRPFLPGSSIAGMLRAACDGDIAKVLFGFSDFNDANNGHASRVFVDDAKLIGPGNITLIDHVRIDRTTGVAAARARFDLEALDANTRFEFRAVLELGAAQSAVLAEFMGVLCQLSNSELSLGRGTQRGYGELKLEKLHIERQDFSSVAGILAVLERTSAKESVAATNSAVTHTLRITVPFKQSGPLMLKASHEGAEINMLPRTANGKDGAHGLILPGSSIKGAFRSHAARIVRSLVSVYDSQLIDVLFGLARTGAGKRAATDQASAPATAGVLRFKTLYASNGHSDAWLALAKSASEASEASEKDALLSPHYKALKAADLRAEKAPANNKQPHVDIAYHVAIDRFTGGAADNMLYTAVEPWHTQWPDLEISFDCTVLEQRLELRGYQDPAAAAQAAQVLLLHLLNDFCNGEIALGFASTRGYGAVSAQRGAVQFAGPANHALTLDKTLDAALKVGSNAQSWMAAAWTEYLKTAETGAQQ